MPLELLRCYSARFDDERLNQKVKIATLKIRVHALLYQQYTFTRRWYCTSMETDCGCPLFIWVQALFVMLWNLLEMNRSKSFATNVWSWSSRVETEASAKLRLKIHLIKSSKQLWLKYFFHTGNPSWRTLVSKLPHSEIHPALNFMSKKDFPVKESERLLCLLLLFFFVSLSVLAQLRFL